MEYWLMSNTKSLKTYLVAGSLMANTFLYAQPMQDPKAYKPRSDANVSEDQTNQASGVDIFDSFGSGLKLKSNTLDTLINRHMNKRSLGSSAYSPAMDVSSKDNFYIDCDNEIQNSQCAEQINHYSLIGSENAVVEFASRVNCQEFNWSDYKNRLDSNTCESRLNCSTRGASRSFLTNVCVPNRSQLNNAIPVDEYNNIVGHAILRNLALSEEAERIQKYLSLAQQTWNIDVPKQCKKLTDPSLSGCSRESLDQMAKSYKDFSNYLTSTDPKLKVEMENYELLKDPGAKTGANIIEVINQVREMKFAAAVDIETDAAKIEAFQNIVFKVLDEGKKLNVEEIKNKVLSELTENDQKYSALYQNAISDFYLVKNTDKLADVIKKYKKLEGQRADASMGRKLLSDIFREDFEKAVASECEDSEQFNLKNSCAVYESLKDKHNPSKQLKFETNANRKIFLGRALDFLSEDSLKKGAFFIRACENTDMQQSFLKVKAASGGGKGDAESIARPSDDLIQDKKVLQAFGDGKTDVAPTTSSTIGKEVSDAAEDSMISSQIASAFSDANNSFANNYNSMQSSFASPNGASVAVSEDEKDSKKSKDSEGAERSQADRSAQGYDAIQKELEGLKAQLAQQQKGAEVQKVVTTPVGQNNVATPVSASSLETELLKKRIAELEKEVAKPTKTKKSSDFDSFDDSVWSRPSGGGGRSLASEASSGAGAKTSARSQSSDGESAGGGSAGGGSASKAQGLGAGAQSGAAGGLQNLSLVKYENQSMVVLPQSATTQDVENKILELNGKPFFIQNADGSYTYVVTDLDKDGKPVLGEDGKPKYMVKKVASDKVSPVKARGVSSVKTEPKVRELKELKDPATRKRELDELLKKTKK